MNAQTTSLNDEAYTAAATDWKVQLNVENLFDVDYFERSSSRNNVYYAAPFTIWGTVSVAF